MLLAFFLNLCLHVSFRHHEFSVVNPKTNLFIHFSGFLEKKHAIVIGASNLCRIIKDSSHYKHIQILAESGGRHEYSSSSSKQNFSKPTLDSLLFRALSRPGCQFVLVFPDILYNSLTMPPN